MLGITPTSYTQVNTFSVTGGVWETGRVPH